MVFNKSVESIQLQWLDLSLNHQQVSFIAEDNVSAVPEKQICGLGPPPEKPNFSVICLGLTKSGKSTLLAVLSGENTDEIEATIGFSIKALMFEDCIVDVKELGGGENIRPYWDKYYSGAEGIVYVVDSTSSKDDLEVTNNELHRALGDPELDNMPLLVLCNFCDKENAKSTEELTKILELDLETGNRKWEIHSCSINDKDSIKKAFESYNKTLLCTRNNSKEEGFSKI